MSPPSKRSRQTAALFVRIPLAEAEKLDRAAFELKARKQDLVSGLVARYIDPSSAAGLDELRRLSGDTPAPSGDDRPGFGFDDRRRVVVETDADTMTVGRHTFRPTDTAEVLTLEQVAELLQAADEAVEALAESGDLPGRRVGGDWRFARSAILEWLARGDRGTEGSAE